MRTFRDVNDAPLSYVVRKQLVPTAESDNPSNGCNTINEEMIERSPIVVAGIVDTTVSLEENRTFTASSLTDWATVWAKLTAIFADSTAWAYYKVGKRRCNGRKLYLALCDHCLRPNNVDHVASESENILQNTVHHR